MNSYWFLLLCMSTLPPLEPTSSLLCVKNDPHTDFFLAVFFLLVGFKQSCFLSEDVLLPSVVKNQGKREHCLQSAHSQTLTLTPLHPPCRHRKVSSLPAAKGSQLGPWVHAATALHTNTTARNTLPEKCIIYICKKAFSLYKGGLWAFVESHFTQRVS